MAVATAVSHRLHLKHTPISQSARNAVGLVVQNPLELQLLRAWRLDCLRAHVLDELIGELLHVSQLGTELLREVES